MSSCACIRWASTPQPDCTAMEKDCLEDRAMSRPSAVRRTGSAAGGGDISQVQRRFACSTTWGTSLGVAGESPVALLTRGGSWRSLVGDWFGKDAPMSRSRLVPLLLLSVLVLGSAPASAETRVFVTNEKSDDVTVIDAATRTVVGTIRVGKRPRGVAVSPDGRRVYVSNSNSDSVSVIDARDLTVLTTVPAGLDPEGLTLDKAGTRLYVVNENELAVTVLDVASMSVVQKIEVGKEPETAVLSPDGRWVVVSNETSNDVYVIETATNTVVKKIPVPKNPRGMRFTPDSRRLFVASEQAHEISVIDVAQFVVVRSVKTGGSRPVDIP